jgi:DNA-binding NarL/FixJ family response regulator
MNDSLKIVLVDDHVLLRNGLVNLVEKLGYFVLYEADNGKDLMGKLGKNNLPDVILLDIKMPEMDGFETARWLREHHPQIKVLALSMYDDENAIIRMLKYGAKGYIVKDSNPLELRTAINAVTTKGFHYSEVVTGKLLHTVQNNDDDDDDHHDNSLFLKLNEKELQFLKLAASEMTYREIAEKMFLSPRTIDGYRDQLFEKLNVKSRVGLVLFAIKHGLVRFD